jgi:hypothetical protein
VSKSLLSVKFRESVKFRKKLVSKSAPIWMKKSKFAEFSRAAAIFLNQKMDNGFVFRAPNCRNPENFIQIGALLETPVYHFLRIPHLNTPSALS